MKRQKINMLIDSLKESVRLYLGISIAVFLFVLFFQPFSVVTFDYENMLLFVSGFGFIVFLFLLLVHVSFSKVYSLDEESRYGNYFMFYLSNFIFTCISTVAFVFYMRYVGKVEITFYVVIKTTIICFGPVVVLNVLRSIQQTKIRYSSLLRDMRVLQSEYSHFSESYSNKIVELVSENESDNFSLQVLDILFVKSADNYVEVGYKDTDEVKKRLLRNTLKSIEIQLRPHNNFVRTHRTCLVNIQYIDKLNKNYNTYWISLIGTKEIIPVARQYLMVVKELL